MRQMTEKAMRAADAGARYVVEFRAYTCSWWSTYYTSNNKTNAQIKANEADQYQCWVRLKDTKTGKVWYY